MLEEKILFKMSKHILVLLFFVGLSLHVIGQELGFGWVNQFGGEGQEYGSTMTIDDSGFVYIAASFEEAIDVDPTYNIDYLTPQGTKDFFLTKMDTLGKVVWTKHFKGYGYSYCYGIAVDTFGNIYLTGTFSDSIDIDPGPERHILKAVNNSNIYMVKFSSSGNLIWVNNIQSSSYTNVSGLELTKTNHLIIAGTIRALTSFNPLSSDYDLSPVGMTDVYIAKYDTAGKIIWAKRISGNGHDQCGNFTVDSDESIYITGHFREQIDLSTSGNPVILNAGIDTDIIFYAKYDSSGTLKWGNMFEANDRCIAHDIEVDDFGNVFLAATFGDLLYFTIEGQKYGVESHKSRQEDIFVSKLDSTGSIVWLNQYGGEYNDEYITIVMGQENTVYVLGFFYDFVEANSGEEGIVDFSPDNGFSVFLAECDTDGNHLWAELVAKTSNIYINDGIVDQVGGLYILGCFHNTADFSMGTKPSVLEPRGYGDIFLKKMTVCKPIQTTLEIATCSQYISPSGIATYFESGIYFDTLMSETGCDSIIEINLSILNTDTILNFSACSPFISISGKHIYRESGTYFDTISNSLGCDSIINLELDLYQVNTDIIVEGDTAYSETSSLQYQWIDCLFGNSILEGQEAPGISIPDGAEYALIIDDGQCVDTSICVSQSFSNLEGIADENDVVCFPNPTSDVVTISFNSSIWNGKMSILNSSGQIILEKEIKYQTELTIPLPNEEGIYCITLSDQNNIYTFHVLKE
jgi:hypothetical protein